jgi:hypothetical protein
MIAAPTICGPQDGDIRREMHKAVAVTPGQMDIGNATIQGMSGSTAKCAVPSSWLYRPTEPKSRPLASLCRVFDLKGGDSHGALPSVCGGNAAPDLETKSNRLTELAFGPISTASNLVAMALR